MKSSPRACIVISDYPIKAMAYKRLLVDLGEKNVLSFANMEQDLFNIESAELVLCDMNIMSEFEPGALSKIEQAFPKAQILFLEEDHDEIHVTFSNQRDLCRLGKLADIDIVHSMLKVLIFRSQQSRAFIAKPKTRHIEQI